MISEELKDYLNHRTDGYFEFKQDLSGLKVNSCVNKYYLPNNKVYYVKSIDEYVESYPMVSAEVLLSRLYPKLGIDSVKYYPLVNNKGKLGVISKDIFGINISDGREFFREVMFKSAGTNDVFVDQTTLYFSDKVNRGKLGTINNFLKYADEDCFKQLFLLRGLDLATANCDRNPDNFFVERDFDGVAKKLIALDYECSGSIDYNSDYYYSEFGKRMSCKNVIQAFKDNEDYQQYITRFEIAEKIATAPFDETAQEIKDEIGFVIEPEYLERMKITSDKIAEELAK